MSYLLNALRKSELERQQRASSSSSFLETPLRSKTDNASKRTRVILLIAALVFLNAFAIIWGMLSVNKVDEDITLEPRTYPHSLPTEKTSSALVGKHENNAIKVEQVAAGGSEIIEEHKHTRLEEKVLNDGVESLSDGAISSQPLEVDLNEPNSILSENHTAKKGDELASVKPESVVELREQIRKVASPVQLATIGPEQSAGFMAEKKERIPLLSELSEEFRRNAPSLSINVFVYANDPSESFVVINMAKYRAGDTLKEGVILEEINADDMVMRLKEQQFRLRRP